MKLISVASFPFISSIYFVHNNFLNEENFRSFISDEIRTLIVLFTVLFVLLAGAQLPISRVNIGKWSHKVDTMTVKKIQNCIMMKARRVENLERLLLH